MLFRVDGMKIIKHIAGKKLNVVDFAGQIAVSTSALNRAMNCDPINLKTVRKIAEALGINVEDFITDLVASR